MKTLIDAQRGHYGVEPICKVLPDRPIDKLSVDWKVARQARTDFVLDALEQAIHARCPKG